MKMKDVVNFPELQCTICKEIAEDKNDLIECEDCGEIVCEGCITYAKRQAVCRDCLGFPKINGG